MTGTYLTTMYYKNFLMWQINGKGKGKAHPRTGHEDPERE
jgi:hypothetical protein